MKTKIIETYKFDELSEETQNKLIEKNRYINVEYSDWWDFVYDEYTVKIVNIGFEDIKIYFSGFYSQGNGAMFEYKSINEKLLISFVDQLSLSEKRKQLIKDCIYVSSKGTQEGRYYHENSCYHATYFEINNTDLYNYPTLSNWLLSYQNDFEYYLEEVYENVCQDLFNDLRLEYEYLTSDEVIKDVLNSYNDDYLIDGVQF
jgi:hypothetical protein